MDDDSTYEQRPVSATEALQRKRGTFLVDDVLTSMPLLLADLIAITTAWTMASLLGRWILGMNAVDLSSLGAALVCFPLAFLMLGTYPGVTTSATRELESLVVAIGAVALGFFALALSGSVIGNEIVQQIFFVVALLILVPLGRSFSRSIGSTFRWWRQPTLILGSDAEVMRIADWLEDLPELGLRPVFRRDLGRFEDRHPTRVILASRPKYFDEELLWRFPRATVLSTEDVFSASTATERIAALTSLKQENRLLNPLNLFLKRSMDLAIAIVIGLLALPLLVLIAIVVKLTSNGPVLFGHKRCGRDGEQFTIRKFRTMHVDADQVLARHLKTDEALRREWAANKKLRRDPRITPVGRLLRRTSLDELPQLWNIIVGDMSLVGPRPILLEEIDNYADVFPCYAMVRPGVTGLWQTSGRNNTSYGERLAYCRYYVRNWSIWLDIMILVRTIKTALLCEGAY